MESDPVVDDPQPEPRPGFHGSWSGFGFPRTYLGKWVVTTVVTLGLPWLILSGVVPLSLGRGLALGLGVVGGLLWLAAAVALTHPLRQADRRLAALVGREETTSPDVASRILARTHTVAENAAVRASFLSELAGQDYTTGLLNRSTAVDRLRQARHLALRDHLPLTAALLDVSDWREEGGEASPQDLLAGVARRVDQLLRGSDWAARWSEDRLLLVMFTDAEGAEIALRRLVEDLLDLKVRVDSEELQWRGVVGAAQLQVDERFSEWLHRVTAAHGLALSDDRGLLVAD